MYWCWRLRTAAARRRGNRNKRNSPGADGRPRPELLQAGLASGMRVPLRRRASTKTALGSAPFQPNRKPGLCGGEGGIRTRDPLRGTRFPIVRTKPDYATSPCLAKRLYCNWPAIGNRPLAAAIRSLSNRGLPYQPTAAPSFRGSLPATSTPLSGSRTMTWPPP